MIQRFKEYDIPVNPEMVEATIAIYEDYILNYSEGKKHIVQLFNFGWEQGESDVEYKVADTHICVSGDKVYKLSAVCIDGYFIPPTHVDEYSKDIRSCDSCREDTHCCKLVNGKYYCNKCLYVSDESNMNSQTEGLSFCEKCSVKKCRNHPEKIFF